jgi:integral membrane protein (TIGR01906 family)
VFGISLAIAVTLTGPLLLFNPWFTSVLQSRHEVAVALDTSQAEIDRVTGEILVDLYVGGDFDAALTDGPPLLDERERSHMGDVSWLVRVLAGTAVLALVLAVVTGSWLRRERRRQGRIMFTAAGLVGAIAVVIAAIFLVAFEPAFLAFHAVFFPPGTYLFSEGSQLIVLFPEAFWFEATLVAGTTIVLTALVAAVIGFARWRDGPDDARRA